MGAADIVIVILVVAVVACAAVRFAGTVSGKRDCCSGEVKDLGPSPRRAASRPAPVPTPASAKVADTDESHYPFEASLTVGGMTCEHCVATVEAALDALPGTWARATLAGGHVRLLSKEPIDEDACRDALERAGYRLVSFKA